MTLYKRALSEYEKKSKITEVESFMSHFHVTSNCPNCIFTIFQTLTCFPLYLSFIDYFSCYIYIYKENCF